MAKSLIGKADSTIVSAAYRSALANVPKDNLETLKIQQGAYKSLLDTVEGVFTAAKEQHEADNLELKGYLQGLEDEIASGTHKSVIQDKTVDDLDIFRQEYKAIPKGKKGEKQRLEWRSKVNKYVNGLKNESEDLTTISDYYLNNGVNIQASGETGNIEFMKAIAKYRANEKDHGLVRNTDTDGNITFTLNGVTKTLPEIVESVVPKDTNVEAAELNIQEKLTKQGLEGVGDIDKNFIYDSISPTLTTKNAYLDFVYKSRGKDGKSIAQEIQSLDGQYTDVIFKVLNDKGILQQLDKGNDGLDRSDFDAKSYKAVADHILKGNNFDMSKSIALDIYSETVGQQALDRGLNAYNIKQANLEKRNKPTIEEEKDKYYSANQAFYGPITEDGTKKIVLGNQLNKIIDNLDSGVITIDGKQYNQSNSDNSWVSDDGDVKSGNDVLDYYDRQLNITLDWYNDKRFARFTGTGLGGERTKQNQLVTTKKLQEEASTGIEEVAFIRGARANDVVNKINEILGEKSATVSGQTITFNGKKYKLGDAGGFGLGASPQVETATNKARRDGYIKELERLIQDLQNSMKVNTQYQEKTN
tara:strand:+ start:474 stop:2234 length:1761 start_codon:yes stop_codon:yes gene_type:complete